MIRKKLTRSQTLSIIIAGALVLGVIGAVACVAGARLPGIGTSRDCDDDDIIERDKDCGFTDKKKNRNPVPELSPRPSKKR